MNRRLMTIIVLLGLVTIGLYFYPRFFSPRQEAVPDTAVTTGRQSNPFGTVKSDSSAKDAAVEGEESSEEEDQIPEKTYRDSFRNPFADYRLKEAEAAAAVVKKAEPTPEEPVRKVEKPVQTAGEIGESKPPAEVNKAVLTPERARAESGLELIGIIGNDSGRRAIIRQQDGQVLIVNEGDGIRNYQVVEIRDEGVVCKYQGVSFNLGMGGGHD